MIDNDAKINSIQNNDISPMRQAGIGHQNQYSNARQRAILDPFGSIDVASDVSNLQYGALVNQ